MSGAVAQSQWLSVFCGRGGDVRTTGHTSTSATVASTSRLRSDLNTTAAPEVPSGTAPTPAAESSSDVASCEPHLPSITTTTPSAADNSFWCFYQAVDGLQYFLHPLNVRCLLAEFGSYDNMPLTIQAPLLEARA